MISVRSKKLKIKHYEICISEGAIYININMKRYIKSNKITIYR